MPSLVIQTGFYLLKRSNFLSLPVLSLRRAKANGYFCIRSIILSVNCKK